jgi:peroxiredoxin Q/BCP
MISVDKPEDNKAFAEKEQADFPMLSDPSRKVAEAYGVLRDYGGTLGTLAQRWWFYIGPDGTLVKIDKTQHTRDAGQTLLAALDALKVPKKK